MGLDWADVLSTASDWAEICREPAQAIRRKAGILYPAGAVGYYGNPLTKVAALEGPADRYCREAIHAAGWEVRPALLSLAELETEPWVKLAYSRPLRTALEWLNFYPGQYPGGFPNHPTPLSALLTSTLVGAGAGYGLGRVGKALLPEGYGDNLGRTGLILGGLAGAGVGSIPGLTNTMSGHPFNALFPLGKSPGEEPDLGSRATYGADPPTPPGPPTPVESPPPIAPDVRPFGTLTKRSKAAWANLDMITQAEPGQSPCDVHVDSLGRVLYAGHLPTNMVSGILGTMYAAQQYPSDRPRSPEWVTGDQLGRLAVNAGSDYVKGLMVGTAVNAAVGTPWSPSVFGAANAAAHAVATIVPQLFGG